MADYKKRKDSERSALKTREDSDFNKIVFILVIAVIIETIAMIYYRRMGSRIFRVGRVGSMNTARYVFAALTVVMAGVTAFLAGLKKNWKYAAWGTLLAGLLFVESELIYYAHGSGALTVCVAAPVLAALAFVYIIFGRGFFAECVLCTLAIVTLAAVRGSVVGLMLYFILTAVLSAGILIALAVLSAGKNGKKGLRDNITVLISAALALVSAVLGLLIGSTFAYGAIIVVAAYLFVDAVYHTVKLM